jgi:hypothetical protein
MAWPIEDDVFLGERQRPPAAMRICSRTRSMPVMASVTGCSTCRRVFISMKKNSPFSYRNSMVPTPR